MRYYILIIILIVIVLVWWFRFLGAVNAVSRLSDGEQVLVEGFLNSQPYHKASQQIMRVGDVFVQAELFPRYNYGDFVRISGSLEKRVTDSGREDFWLMYPNIELVETREGAPLSGWLRVTLPLYRIRRLIEQNLAQLLPEPHASLLSGVLLGVRRQMPEAFRSALRRTGTMHVVVASGYNVTVVAGVLVSLLVRVVSRRWALPFALFGIAAYTIMAGADAPIVRAALMATFLLVAQFFGRPYIAVWALVLTSGLMLVVSPLLIYDVGFQLSVAATFGILTTAPLITHSLFRLFPVGRGVWDELGITLGAQLAVLPILLTHFGQVSWLSPAANLLVAGLVPVIMGLGGLLALAGFIWVELARVVALFAWVPLSLFIFLVSWFARLPFGTFAVSPLPLWWTLGYYCVLFTWVLGFRQRLSRFLSVR